MPVDGSMMAIFKTISNKRTILQNRALHKFLTLVAEALNASGWSYWAVLFRKTAFQILAKRKEISESEFSPDYKKGYLQALDHIQETLPKAGVDWTMELVKENMWKPIQASQTGKNSTAEADRSDYKITYENLNRVLGSEFGVHVPWPVEKKNAH